MYVYVSQKHLASDDLLALSDVKQAFPTKSLVRLPFIQYTHFYMYRSVRVVWQLTIINNFDVLEFLLFHIVFSFISVGHQEGIQSVKVLLLKISWVF